jgi:hypothetical protein
MRNLSLALVVTIAISLSFVAAMAADAPGAKGDDNPGLARLKSMAGEWKGTSPDGKPVKLITKVASGGSAVVEQMDMHGDMITVYHADGPDLMLTHFCGIGNQPRMRAAAPSADAKSLDFKFVDATNLPDPPKQPHIHDLKITFVDDDHITQEWIFYKDGKAADTAKFSFERVK